MTQPENLALALIEKEKWEKTGFLDLGNCGLTEVPEEVRDLVWLKDLVLGTRYATQMYFLVESLNKGVPNTINHLPDWFSELSELKILILNQNPLSDITPLAELDTLLRLHCDETKLTDLSPLVNLTSLQILSCADTPITDLMPLVGLINLRELDCSWTKVTDLSPLSKLKSLIKLNFMVTNIHDLSPLANLCNLESLNCSTTSVADLLPLSKLSRLEILDCYNTSIADLSPIEDLVRLQYFDCSETLVADLSPVWPGIQQAWPVKWEFSEGYLEIGNNFGIYVQDCPLIIPPVEFAIEGPEAVVEYFEQLGDDARPLNEVKVIFLGEGAAGKTSLIKRLRDEEFDPKESQTHGIRIQKTPFTIDEETILAHCWDFGGQEVNHATHQFFLSQRCIYVVVLNSRSDDKAEKWLKHASSFGGRSPVLVVLNKIDENPSFQVNQKLLSEKYPNIRGYYRLSCGTGMGVDAFRQAISHLIEQADARRTPFPASWLAVKEHFANMTQDYIDSAHYRAVCEHNGVTRRISQDVLLQFLHDLGLVINFRNLKNFDTQILNPLWLTNGVYRIINSERVANAGGLLHEDDLDAIINDPRYAKTGDRVFDYPLDKLNYIVRVMQEFELCFRLDDCRYVVPQLLPVSEPDFHKEGKGLRFVIRFPELLPDSIFPRLMVKLHSFIEGELRWRTGMVLHKPSVFNASARVREDKEDKEIQIEVCGQEPRRLLSFIRETVKEIVASFANLPTTEWVPIPDCDENFEYEYLVVAEKAGEKEVFVRQLKKRIPVADLLDGVEEQMMRDELAQTPVKAFVSYSHKDLEYLPDLRAALSPLVRLDKLVLWDDRAIEAGEEWNKVIFQQLAEADLVLCLISADFIHSDFCYTQELAEALSAHHQGEKTVIPIRLRECLWDDLPLAKIQGMPSQWISAAADKDAAWTELAKSLEPAISQAKIRKLNARK